jgi:sphingolipid delta-4 desaturase
MKQDFTYVDEPPLHTIRRREIAARHPRVRELMVKNPLSALWIVLLVAAQWLVAAQMPGASVWIIFATAILFGAFVNHALYVMIHECTHSLVFRSARLNRVFGILCDFALVLPSAMGFHKYHLMHHRYLGQYEMDPDILSHGEARLIGNSAWRKALWVFLLPVSQALRPSKLSKLRGIKLWDGWIVANLILILALDAAIALLLGPAALGYLALSTLFALGLHPLGGRWIQEHHVTCEGQDTYSYYGPLNRVCFNMGYHNEHHDFPNVPWNHLPKVRRLAGESYAGLASYDSWIAVLWHFIFDPAMSGYSRIVHPATPMSGVSSAGAAIGSAMEAIHSD